MRRLLPAALVVALAVPFAASPSSATPAESNPATESSAETTTAAATELTVTGHGYGHGRGMGQYGAYGYAKDIGWDWHEITDHFYGGTSEGALASGRHVDVLLKGLSGAETLVMVEQGGVLTNVDLSLPPMPERRAVRVVANPDGTFVVYQGTDCATWDAGTMVTPAPTNGHSILVVKPAVAGSDNPAEMASVCTSTDHRFYRGEIWVGNFNTTGSTGSAPGAKQQVMNHVWIESYLRAVVPAESPSSWGDVAGGMNALAAQAVAARSYAAAGDTRWGWASTCDDIFCQVYPGFARAASASALSCPGGTGCRESTNGDQAVAMTEDVIRTTSTGGTARTEFSSSTGGYTAGGAFPAVVDDGDAVTANPNHNWSASVPVSSVETAFDTRAGADLGTFEGFSVLSRNGLGEDGGRVTSIRAAFANGTVTVTGDQFRSMFSSFGVKSDWFTPGGSTGPGGFSDTAGNAHAENIAKIVDAGIASGYPDGTFRPNDPVSRGQMATFITNGYDLPAAASPFTDTAGTTHEASIGAVANAGIAGGYPDGTYRPDQSITRGQMAVFLARAEGLEPVDGEGGLCDIDGHLYEGFIRAVVAANIASGTADGCFHPDDPVVRGQMATFLVNALGL